MEKCEKQENIFFIKQEVLLIKLKKINIDFV